MRRLKVRFAVLLLAAFALPSLTGCRVASGPAGFWKAYRTDLVVAKSSDQGPWGGELWIAWHAPEAGVFTFAQARAIAESHGWKMLSDQHRDATRTDSDVRTSSPRQPSFLPMSSTVGRFDSGWLREDPGTNQMSTAVGYVQVSDDGRDMYVHHFWGNG